MVRASSLRVLLVIVGVAACGPAWSAPGAVLSDTKISGTVGGFTASLSNSDEVGGAVAALGDLDGPGPSVAALIAGAIGDDDGGTDRGAAYVLFLDRFGAVLSNQKISDDEGNFSASFSNADEFGGSVAYLGDLDGAGPSVAAVAVGAVGDDDGGLNRGCVYILFLNANGTVHHFQKISDTVGGFTASFSDADEFGSSVTNLGDLDGAGPSVTAIAVGAIGDDDGGSDRGCVYVLFLNATGSVLSYQKISDTDGNFTATMHNADEFGCAVASLGDLDGAGPSAAALAVGAFADDDGGSSRGAAYVLFLNAAGSVLSHQKISDTSGNLVAALDDDDEFGNSVGNLGDLDGSGPSALTLAVGAVGDDDGGTDRGAVYLLFLDAAGNILSESKISDTAGNFSGSLDELDDFGGTITALGVIDSLGSAKQTMVVGVSGDDDGGTDRGAAYLLFLEGELVLDVGPSAPRASHLGPPRPNPFRPRTTIPFRIDESARVRIIVSDVHGRLVRSVVDAGFGPGDHQVAWDGLGEASQRLTSGVYFVQMSIDGQAVMGSRKVVLLE